MSDPAPSSETDEPKRFVGRLLGLWRRPDTAGSAVAEPAAAALEQSGEHERTLIANILEIRDQPVADFMVPRADIVAVPADATLDRLLTIVAERPHSRLPVYRQSLDDVLGIVRIKDVLAGMARSEPFDLATLARPVLIVAPSLRALDLLLEMRKERTQMALVIDEFGGIDGLVTIEDLVEGIVGEIEDEQVRGSEPAIVERPDGTLIADARLSIEDFEAKIGAVLSEDEREEADTLGGLVFALAGRIPNRGELIRHPSGMEFEVLETDPRRIKRLRVRPAGGVAGVDPTPLLAQAG